MIGQRGEKGQHPAGFKPTIFLSGGLCSTAVLQPLPLLSQLNYLFFLLPPAREVSGTEARGPSRHRASTSRRRVRLRAVLTRRRVLGDRRRRRRRRRQQIDSQRKTLECRIGRNNHNNRRNNNINNNHNRPHLTRPTATPSPCRRCLTVLFREPQQELQPQRTKENLKDAFVDTTKR